MKVKEKKGHISYEDKLKSIQNYMFDTARDLRWVQNISGCVVFHARGCVWSTTEDIFEIILEINPHGCTNLPST